jgi:hypothetical protein
MRSSPNIIRAAKSSRMAWAENVARMGRGAYRVLVGNPDGKRPLGRPRCRWEDTIKMHFRVEGMNLIDLTQNRDKLRELVKAILNLRVPCNAGNFLTSCETVSLSRRTLLHGVGYVMGVKDIDCLYLRHVYVTLAVGYKSAVLRVSDHNVRCPCDYSISRDNFFNSFF